MNSKIYGLLISKRVVFYVGLIIVAFYYIPYLLLGEDMYVNDHDFLDSHHAYLKVLKDNNALFNPGYLFPAMDGVPVSGFDSLYPLRCLIYYIFPPYYAFLIGDAIARFIAFVGMFLLLNRFKIKKLDTVTAAICSILFGWLYFHDGYFELGSAGIPLLIWSFLNLRDNKHIYISYATIIFIASFSSIFHLAFFACIIFFTYYLYMLKKSGERKWNFLAGIFVLGLSSLLFSYSTFIHFFISDEPSHRIEFVTGKTLIPALNELWETLLTCTQEHTGSLPTAFITILFVFCITNPKEKIRKPVLYILFSICGILLFWLFYQLLKQNFQNFHIIHEFQADRFYFWLPTLWILLLFYLITGLRLTKSNVLVALVCVCCTFIMIVRVNPELSKAISSLRKPIDYPTYRQFFDENLFASIKKQNNIDSHTKVCALGLYPSILSYNGLYTCDGYFVSYPLNYKKKFRHVIEKELNKCPFNKNYYDNWGSRCFLFNAEVNKDYKFYSSKNEDAHINQLDIDTDFLKSMECQYIFSAITIQNALELNLKIVGEYSTPNSYWNIKLYKLL